MSDKSKQNKERRRKLIFARTLSTQINDISVRQKSRQAFSNLTSLRSGCEHCSRLNFFMTYFNNLWLRSEMFFAKISLRLKRFYRTTPPVVVRNIPQVQLGSISALAEPAHRGRRNFCRWSKNILVPSDNRRWTTQGQTLVELMVAMSVMIIGLLGVFAVLSQSLGLNRVIADQYVAVNLAAEGIEVVKNIADSNVLGGRAWNAGLRDGDFGVQYDSESLNLDWKNQDLKFNSATGLYSYGVGKSTNFQRTISITNITANEIRVKSVVKWRDRGGREFNVDLEDRFFNWRPS